MPPASPPRTRHASAALGQRLVKASRHARLLLVLASLVAGALPAQAAEFTIGPPPAWVLDLDVDLAAPEPEGKTSGGVHYLLSDMQLKAGAEPVHFNRLAMRATSSDGLDSVAHLEMDFDPAFQALTLHWVDVLRDGRRIAKLPTAQVRVIQREQELEYRIYDGRKTATLFLDDVRVGDVVDYAFSVSGQNPAFGDAIFGGSAMQWDVPVRDDHTRLLVPRGQALQFKGRHGAPDPVRSTLGGFDQYVWRQADVSPQSLEEQTPGWYDDFASVQWSQYRHWGEVVDWALPLYAPQDRLDATADAELERIAKAYATSAERTVAVLRFVQSQIRYLGVEVGAGSFQPNPPYRVLERRFGDCKDKTLLMLSMLHRLGITAHAALVHTELRRGLADQLPAPDNFDHVLVRVRLEDRDYWLDPTSDTQFGSLAAISQADFGLALVVEAGNRTLAAMRGADERAPARAVHTQFDARDGMDKPARMTVTTTLELRSAETLRNQLAGEPRQQTQNEFLNYYAAYYPDITLAKPMEVQDDRERNRLVTVEHYAIPAFWTTDEDSGVRTAVAHAADMRGMLEDPSTPIRRAPLALAHPVDFTHTTEILLHEDWPIEDEAFSAVGPGFRFDRKTQGQQAGRRVLVEDRYRTLADHVAASDMPRHMATLKDARDQLGFEFTLTPPGAGATSGGFNLTLALVAGLLACVLVPLAWRAYRYDPPPSGTPTDPSLAGLRGWLVLPAIGVAVTPLSLLAQMAMNLAPYSLATWSSLATPGNAQYHALWVPLLLFELMANMSLLALALLVAALFFQRRRSLPRFYIAMLALSALVLALDLALLRLIPAGWQEVGAQHWGALARALLAAAIWIPYFLVSRRVQATFTEGLAQPRRAAGPPPLPLSWPAT